MGDVFIYNTKDDLKIDIRNRRWLLFKDVNIHVVQDPEVFADEILDRKGLPKPPWFSYRTDYLDDYGVPWTRPTRGDSPLETSRSAGGSIRRSVQPNLYIIVHAEL